MQISEDVIKSYLIDITMGRMASRPDPMEDLSRYDDEIETMRERAAEDGNEEWLRAAMNALLAQPEGRITDFKGYVYMYSEDQLAELFTYAFELLWPDEPVNIGGETTPFEIVSMTDEEWEAAKTRAKLGEDG